MSGSHLKTSPVASAAILTICLLSAPACSGETGQGERRCAELGKDICICSEPLDNSDVYAEGSEVSTHDPSDSAAMECMPGEEAWGSFSPSSDPVGTSRFPVAFPPGSSVVHVLHQAVDRFGPMIFSESLDEPAANKTLCAREYLNWDAAHPTSGTNIKLSKMGDGNLTNVIAWQFEALNGQPGLTVQVSPRARPGILCSVASAAADGFSGLFASCKDHWCRFEICVDYEAATGNLYPRARIVQVGGELLWEASSDLPAGEGRCPPSRLRGLPDLRFEGSSFVGCDNEGTPESQGGVYMSHAMFARSPFDPAFWIGKACEIEGC